MALLCLIFTDATGAEYRLDQDGNLIFLQVSKRDNAWVAEKTWQISELTMRFSSPVQKGQSHFRILQPEQRDLFLRRRRQRKNTLDQRSQAGRQRGDPDFGRAFVSAEG